MNTNEIKNLEVIDGKIIVPMAVGPAKQIDLDKLQSLFSNDIALHVHEVILSVSQIMCCLIRDYSDQVDIIAMQDYFPSADNLWMLNQIFEAFKTEW